MSCGPLPLSKLLVMSEHELLIQLEKASTTLSRLKTANSNLRKRLRELQSRGANEEMNKAAAPTATAPAKSSEVQDLRDQLSIAQQAAIDNLAYAQEMRDKYEELVSLSLMTEKI